MINPNAPFYFMDYETGGLRPYAHGPASAAVAYFNEGQYQNAFTATFKPVSCRGYCEDAFGINGLSIAKLTEEGEPEAQIYADLATWANRHGGGQFLPIWAHNAEFDLGFYADGTTRVKTNPLLGPWGCTKLFSRHVWPQATKHDLNSVLIWVGFKRSGDIHGALEDARLGGLAFIEMMKILRGNNEQTQPS
jgi:DNA polymerase-3 subunit epsilon